MDAVIAAGFRQHPAGSQLYAKDLGIAGIDGDPVQVDLVRLPGNLDQHMRLAFVKRHIAGHANLDDAGIGAQRL